MNMSYTTYAAVMKKIDKTFENCYLYTFIIRTLIFTALCKNRASMGHTQNQVTFFFLEITKGDHKLSRTFYLIKIS